MLPKVKEQEHNKKENLKRKKNPEYQLQPYTPTNIRPGRPSKKRLKAAGSILGRPKETVGRIAEFKERLLATAGKEVIDKIIKIALDDTNDNQIAALKMCIDRVLPLSLFDKAHNGNRAIEINIINTTHDEPSLVINSSEDIIEET